MSWCEARAGGGPVTSVVGAWHETVRLGSSLSSLERELRRFAHAHDPLGAHEPVTSNDWSGEAPASDEQLAAEVLLQWRSNLKRCEDVRLRLRQLVEDRRAVRKVRRWAI